MINYNISYTPQYYVITEAEPVTTITYMTDKEGERVPDKNSNDIQTKT